MLALRRSRLLARHLGSGIKSVGGKRASTSITKSSVETGLFATAAAVLTKITMATPTTIRLDVRQKPTFYVPGMEDEENAKKASELLQRNHQEHHIFFNREGFHNHIVHHILTLYALGADPAQLQRHYDANALYQRPTMPVHESDVEAMSDPSKFQRYLSDERHYHDYLVFFQQEMQAKGWQNVVNEYLFAGDERADDLLVRTFAGFLHPLIHLGFGIEFQQPAIVAEAMAQAAVHDSWIGKLLVSAEKAARVEPPKDGGKTLAALLREIHDDEEVRNAARWSDGNKIRDGVIARAGARMLSYATQFVVRPQDDVARKTAEMINAAVLFAGAAQRPTKAVKFDFYFIHCVNASIFFSAFLRQPWLSDDSKRRLLEWKARLDLAMYASRRAPDLLVDEIVRYRPRRPGADPIRRALEVDDDGHAAKLVRALCHAKKACEQFDGEPGFEINGDMWDQLLHMAVDSVEASEPHWVRSAGFDEAWRAVQDRPHAAL
ncbi:uncharacterized protein PV09_07080 [Verruconis gallopava]|uniref:HypA protein n=1 Tax=Verruconis gallopava TaxID=253628 RepID=A0A0D2A495_9PEZI|nr:uncharacterized protein PV09_07080 [Verruconis gallopava]KIW01608.1 hypothetical protein PV09_07080 [Verruconis gallopava]